MHWLVVVGLLLSAAPEFGQAPKESLNPSETMNRLRDVFRDCAFTAVQTKQSRAPSGGKYTEITHVICRACKGAVVVHSTNQIKDLVIPGVGRQKDTIVHTERRWAVNEGRQQCDLSLLRGGNWPVVAPQPGAVKIKSLAVHPKRDLDQDLVWEELLVGHFVGEVNLLGGVTFTDMVTDGGDGGFVLEQVTWASADRMTSIAYHSNSADFGAATVTFTKAGTDWLPAAIRFVKSAEHKMAPTGRIGPGVRLKNFKSYNDFSEPAPGLDRLEDLYELSYASADASDRQLPRSIKRTETRVFKNEESVVTTTLVFDGLRSGNVACDEVRDALLPIPDGTTVYVLDEELRNIAWTTKDGDVVKKIDLEAVDVGQSATFSSSPALAYLLVGNGLAVIVAIVMYRRAHLKEG